MFRFLLVVAFILAVAVSFSPLTPKPFKKASISTPSKITPKSVGTSGKKAAVVVNKKFGKDMTWGGRPDPTPELIVTGAAVPFASSSYEPKTPTSLGGFLEAPWRYNLRKD